MRIGSRHKVESRRFRENLSALRELCRQKVWLCPTGLAEGVNFRILCDKRRQSLVRYICERVLLRPRWRKIFICSLRWSVDRWGERLRLYAHEWIFIWFFHARIFIHRFLTNKKRLRLCKPMALVVQCSAR
jgi:hypothetical protein